MEAIRKAILMMLLAAVSSSTAAQISGNIYLSCTYDTPPYMRGRSIQIIVDDKRDWVWLGDGAKGEDVSINSVRIAFRDKGILIEVDRLNGRFMTTGDKFPANGTCAVVPKPKF